MYLHCEPCGISHKDILQRDAAHIAKAFIDGEAQFVTRHGIITRCLLDILGRSPTQRTERMHKKQQQLDEDDYYLDKVAS